MLMEDRLKFFSPQNTVGVSLEKDVVAISQTIAVNGDQVSHIEKTHN